MKIKSLRGVPLNNLLSQHHKRITIFLIALLILIPLGIISYSLLYEDFRDEKQAEIAKNNQVADHAARYLNEYLDGYKSALKNLAATPSIIYEDRQVTKRMMQDFDLARPESSLFWVADSKGEFVAKYPDEYMDQSILDREFFKEAMKGESFIGGPYISTITGQEIIAISVPYYRNNKVAGVAGVSIPLVEIQKRLSLIQVGDKGYVSLVSLKGDILSHPHLAEYRETFSFHQTPLYGLLFVDKLERGYFDRTPNEPGRMHSFVKLKEAPWVAIAVQPLQELYIKLLQTFGRNLLVLLIVGIFVGFLIHYILLLKDMKNAEKIKQTEKLAVVGELAAGVAHEIRNPLTSIKGFVQLIDSKKGAEVPPFYIETILDELDRIEQIVGEMVVLAKPAHEEKSQVNLSLLLQDTVNLMSPQAGMRNVMLRLEIKQGLPFVKGVRNQLKQVMINLIKNSIEAMGAEDKGEIMITATYEAEHIFITVTDNGEGIEPEVINKLGTPFFTTKDSGTGLGLMISYGIIQNHEGEIEVESKPGVGTKFNIILPAITIR